MNAWTLSIEGIEQGLVTVVNMSARRKCGRVEQLGAYLFPAGWRMTAPDVPQAVRTAALRLARETWSD